ncbi:PREDICTED: sperm flagellar protein 2-like [Merops nubicus]|uniref:sperm flagellar protein 2-like n=1 Tax=Merops nubicus TaxID=57421 RepID=UPI0004F0240A|nr:PREDICTED: sperm flagellar protein 2-like [Merops nubicus]
MDKEWAGRLHSKSCSQRLDVRVETSDEWCSSGIADKSKSSQTEQEKNNQNSEAEIQEEMIDLARDKVLHRISGFLDAWPKLEKWFSVHRNVLVKVDAEREENLVCETVKEIIMEVIAKNQNRRSAQETLPGKELVPVIPQDLLPPIPMTAPPIERGSDEQIYVDEPLPKEIPDFLVPYWEMVENTYMNTIKTILRHLRDEEHSVISYIADIRKKFQDYLKTPDHKQEFVSQWQSEFNSVADDLREDEETKAELHQRVTDLRDHLWDICDNRRKEAEQERSDIVNDGWVQDHRGIAMNHFFSLMQVEVDRFQDTKRILHDYYRAMEGKIPTHDCQDFTRIPLLDIIDVEQKEDQSKSRRIPLVSWKLPSPEINISKSKAKGTVQKRAKDENSEKGVATSGNDENLITDTWQTAVTAVSNMVTAEIRSKEMEEEREHHYSALKADLKSSQTLSGKATGKDNKEGKKLPAKSVAKNKGSPATSVAEDSPVPIAQEELKKQELALKIKQEYFSALKHEEVAAKSRLELIKEKALAFVKEFTMKTEEAYRDMEKWLGSRFLAEMSSVEKLVEVARHHVESSSKIVYKVTLEETDFFISSDEKVIPEPVPSSHVPQTGTSGSGTLTISQLTTLHKQFLQVAPKGFIPKKIFIDIFVDLINLNLGTNCLPDAWMNLTLPDLENLASAFTVHSGLTDWRRFLLSAAQPWPVPSVTQLLNVLHSFKSVDVAGSGFVTQEYYMQVGLWFNGNEDLSVTKSFTEPLPSDRLRHLIKFFFNLFADTSNEPALINYPEMLLYFASHSDPVEGVYRALSIATGTYIHRKEEASLPREDFSYTNIGATEKTSTEDEKEVLNYTGEGIISVANLLKVFHTAGSKDEDNHRFSNQKKEGSYEKLKHFIKIYKELGTEDLTPIPVALLLKHPFIQDLINSCQEYELPNINTFLQRSEQVQSTDGKPTTCKDINA